MTHLEKLAAVRSEMESRGLAAYIVPSSDPHIGEYLPERYRCIAWLSGFTGSAGTLAITPDFAGLWTDSRYFVQAGEQLAGTGFELVKLNAQGAAEYADWLAERLPEGSRVGFDGHLASMAVAQAVSDTLVPLGIRMDGSVDILSAVWPDRPALPTAKAYLLDESATGEPTPEKLRRISGKMREKRADAHLISSLDDLAWTLNIRGRDVKCNPVVLGFLLLEGEKNTLFIDQTKLSEEDRRALEAAGLAVSDYGRFARSGCFWTPDGPARPSAMPFRPERRSCGT